MYFNGTETESTMPPIQLKIFKIVNDVEMAIGESSKLAQRSVANKSRKIHPTIEATDFLIDTHASSRIET